MFSSAVCFTLALAALFGPTTVPPAIVLFGAIVIVHWRHQMYDCVDAAIMHTFTTAWILRMIAEYPVTANPETYSRLHRELGNRFNRQADLLSAELRKYNFNSRYFAELPLCDYLPLRVFLISSGMYQPIRDFANCLGLLPGSMLAEYHQKFTNGNWPSPAPPYLSGCVDTSISGCIDTHLHGPLSFIVCTVCHPAYSEFDMSCRCGAQMYAAWAKWTAGILPATPADTAEYAAKCAHIEADYEQFSDSDKARCDELGAVVHTMYAATHPNTSLPRVLGTCAAVYMPAVLIAAYLAACVI